MREIRTSGSEGGGAGYSTGPHYPYGVCRPPGWFDAFRLPTRAWEAACLWRWITAG